MRVAMIGVSHWHWHIYLNNLTRLKNVALVGVCDADATIAARVAEQAGCPFWTEYREMCAAIRPDMVFALGYHLEMADTAHFLLDSRIPFAMEKPCGATSGEVDEVARHAAQCGVFASTCFSMRCSPLLSIINEVAAGEHIHYLSFKFIGGLLARYPAMNSEWVIQRARSGGGALLNLGVHCLDLTCQLLPETPVVTGARMSKTLGSQDVEDHALVILECGESKVLLETGYMYPPKRSSFDLHYGIRTDSHYFVVENDHTIEMADEAGEWRRVEGPTANNTCYPSFVEETVRRVERGEPPLADMSDMARVLKLVEAAYEMSPLDARTR